MKKLLETRIWTFKVLAILDIEMHQLFGLCKEGHLQAYDNFGRKVVDINSCEKGVKRSYERIEKIIRQNEFSKIADRSYHGKPLTKWEINSKAWEEYNAQPLDTPINPDPENCVLFDFSPSKKNFKGAMSFEFSEDEVLNLVEEKTLLELGEEQRPAGHAPDGGIEKKVFPCQPGTKWEDIKITLIADDKVKIKTPQGEDIFSYNQLGMANKRTRDRRPSALWRLFTQFCEHQGFIAPKSSKYIGLGNLVKTASRLNIHLKKLFKIDESIYTGHYKKTKGMYSDQEKVFYQDTETTSKEPRTTGYKTRIFFSDQTNVTY
jgi:hypothetical protein